MKRYEGEELRAYWSAMKRSSPTLLFGRTYISPTLTPDSPSAQFLTPYFSSASNYEARLIYWACFVPGAFKRPVWCFPINRAHLDCILDYHCTFIPGLRLEEFQLSARDRLGIRQRGPFVNNVRR